MEFWLKLFFFNWFLNICLVEYTLAKLKNIIKVDEERDSKYKAFRRNDVKWFNRFWLYPCCHLTLLKLVSTFGMLFCTAAWATVSVYG